MIDAHQLSIFIPAIIVLVLLPGQDVLFVLSQSARGGATAGLVGVAGILTGFLVVHVTGAAIGLSALIAHSTVLFLGIKYAGAAYLVYLGVRALFGESERAEASAAQPVAHKLVFVQGFLTNVLNPKIAVFMVAFLPQFLVPAHGHVAMQIFVLGAIWAAAGLIVLSAVALIGGLVPAFRLRSAKSQNIQRYVRATIFIGLGLRIALPESR